MVLARQVKTNVLESSLNEAPQENAEAPGDGCAGEGGWELCPRSQG